jgi:DNA-binding NarL/FixJ family response regulator
MAWDGTRDCGPRTPFGKIQPSVLLEVVRKSIPAQDLDAQSAGLIVHSQVDLIATGKKTREIARSVHLAERTVKHYLELICEKLGAENRSHAVALAVQRGLIRVDDR